MFNNKVISIKKYEDFRKLPKLEDLMDTTYWNHESIIEENNEILFNAFMPVSVKYNYKNCIELLGHTKYKEPISVIINTKPEYFYCVIPHGMDPKEFLNRCKRVINNEIGSYNHGKYSITIEQMHDGMACFPYQKFNYLKISSSYRWILSKAIELSKQLYINIIEKEPIYRNEAYDRLINKSPIRHSIFISDNKWFYNYSQRNQISLCGWFKFKADKATILNHDETFAKVKRTYYINNEEDIEKFDTCELPNIALIGAYDIETLGLDPMVKTNKIFSNAIAFKWTDEDNLLFSIVFSDFVTEPHKDYCTVNYPSDKEAIGILIWAYMLDMMYCDIVCDFNGQQFDINYINERSKQLNINDQLEFLLSRYNLNKKKYMNNKISKNEISRYLCKIQSSSAKGEYGKMIKDLTVLQTPGRLFIDVMLFIKRLDPKGCDGLGASTLSGMCKRYNIKDIRNPELQADKTGLTYNEMFNIYYSNDNNKKQLINTYNDGDVCATLALFEGYKIYSMLMENAFIGQYTIEDAALRAGGKMTEIRYLNSAFEHGYLLQDVKNVCINRNKRIVAGLVAVEHPGMHENVTGLDFNSMYPSINIGYNILPQCRVNGIIIEYPELYGYECLEKTEINDYLGERFKYKLKHIESGKVFIVQQYYCEYNRENNRFKKTYFIEGIENSFFGRTMQYLWDFRNHLRKLHSECIKEGDYIKANIFNIRQQKVKEIMNSLYGKLQDANFSCADKKTGGTITYIGRMLITFLKNSIESNVITITPSVALKTIDQLINGYNNKVIYSIELIDNINDYRYNIEYDSTFKEQLSNESKENVELLIKKLKDNNIISNDYTIHDIPVVRITKVTCEVVYGDTDSKYFKSTELNNLHKNNDYDAMHKLDILRNVMKNLLTNIINRTRVGMDVEAMARRMYVAVEKKRYVYITVDDFDNMMPEEYNKLKPSFKDKNIKSKGYEVVRRDCQPYIQTLQKGFFEELLSGNVKNMTETVFAIIDKFTKTFDDIPVVDLAKSQKYSTESKNNVLELVARMKQENHPCSDIKENDKLRFVVPDLGETSADYIKVNETIRHIRDFYLNGKLPDEPDISNWTIHKIYKPSYHYYFQKVIKTFAKYIISELYEYEYNSLIIDQDNTLTSADIKKQTAKLYSNAEDYIKSMYYKKNLFKCKKGLYPDANVMIISTKGKLKTILKDYSEIYRNNIASIIYNIYREYYFNQKSIKNSINIVYNYIKTIIVPNLNNEFKYYSTVWYTDSYIKKTIHRIITLMDDTLNNIEKNDKNFIFDLKNYAIDLYICLNIVVAY